MTAVGRAEVQAEVFRHRGAFDHDVVAPRALQARAVPGVLDGELAPLEQEPAHAGLGPDHRRPDDGPAAVVAARTEGPIARDLETAGFRLGLSESAEGGDDAGIFAAAIDGGLGGLGEVAQHPLVLHQKAEAPAQRARDLGHLGHAVQQGDPVLLVTAPAGGANQGQEARIDDVLHRALGQAAIGLRVVDVAPEPCGEVARPAQSLVPSHPPGPPCPMIMRGITVAVA